MTKIHYNLLNLLNLCLVFALNCSKVRGSSDKLSLKNKRKIDKVALILWENIKEDLKTL